MRRSLLVVFLVDILSFSSARFTFPHHHSSVEDDEQAAAASQVVRRLVGDTAQLFTVEVDSSTLRTLRNINLVSWDLYGSVLQEI